MESNNSAGPIPFDCYPNITFSLRDKFFMKSLILKIKTYNYNILGGSIPVATVFQNFLFSK
jgi:hypothetical protein